MTVALVNPRSARQLNRATLTERRYRKAKARSTSGRKRKSTPRSARRRRCSIFITTCNRTATRAKAVRDLLRQSREKLLAIRAKRPQPHLDDKILASWNGLMISAYARAAQVLGESRYLESAARSAKFLRANLYDQSRKL